MIQFHSMLNELRIFVNYSKEHYNGVDDAESLLEKKEFSGKNILLLYFNDSILGI